MSENAFIQDLFDHSVDRHGMEPHAVSYRLGVAAARPEVDRLERDLTMLIDALHDREVALDQTRQLAALRQARIRELELQMDEAAALCEANMRELRALQDALVPLIAAAQKASAA